MVPTVTNIAENFARVSEQVAQAAIHSGRDPSSVRLVVVTKTHPADSIRAVVEAGAHWIGESYVEEALPKMDQLQDMDISWHMIGHVQSRKSAIVAGRFHLIHSLDDLKLARRIDAACRETSCRQKVLLEFNLGGEPSKSGFSISDNRSLEALLPEIEAILAFPNLEVDGLMTIPPLLDDPESARPYFRRLREIRDILQAHFPNHPWSDLSMGMSGDFVTAVEEGATWVRVGTAIMGPRK